MVHLKRSKKEVVSYKMSRVRAKGSEIEKIMGSALWVSGLRGYRKNLKGVLGTPDFCWKRKKIAVFCDSSFWHGFNWSKEKNKIKVRKAFWFDKINANIARDRKVTQKLKQEGWMVFRYWEFEIEKNALLCARKVATALTRRNN